MTFPKPCKPDFINNLCCLTTKTLFKSTIAITHENMITKWRARKWEVEKQLREAKSQRDPRRKVKGEDVHSEVEKTPLQVAGGGGGGGRALKWQIQVRHFLFRINHNSSACTENEKCNGGKGSSFKTVASKSIWLIVNKGQLLCSILLGYWWMWSCM